MENMNSEFVVIEGSPLIGMSLEEIAKGFGVKILHYHNQYFGQGLELGYKPEAKIAKYFVLSIKGPYENVMKLRLKSVDFK